MRDFIDYLRIVKQNPERRYALATIIHVKGSAYRHEGAKMLFSESGERFGTISGGCLEEDLSHVAMEVIEHQSSKTIEYDLSSEDDLSWGQGAGCNGAVTIYVEYIQGDSNDVLQVVGDLLANGKSLLLLKTMDNSTNILVGMEIATGKYFGNTDDKRLKKLLENKISLKEMELSHDDMYGEILIESLQPKEELFIFGAGPDVIPLVNTVSQMDFNVHVIDPRSNYCNELNFPNATTLTIEHPGSYLVKNSISHNSYVLIMTHNFNWDRTILNYLLKKFPYYLGILGPRRRTRRLLPNVDIPDWISSPVGLDIDAEGPEEISISIAAELVKVKNGKGVKTLKKSKSLVQI